MPSEIESLSTRIDAGFDKVFDKVEDLRKDFYEHKVPCATEFASIKEKLAIRNAVGCVEDQQEEKERDWGRWAVRMLLGLIAAGVIGLWLK